MSCKKRCIRLGIMLVVLALVASGCGPSAAPTSAPVPTQGSAPAEATAEPAPAEATAEPVAQVLNIASTEDTGDLLDPHGYASLFLGLASVYEGLTDVDADGNVVPKLAESWEISDDGLTYTFHLRKGVVFHDGTPLNAEAVKWNFEQMMAKGKEENWQQGVVKNMTSVEVVDPDTVRFTFSEAQWTYIVQFGYIRPVRLTSPKAVDAEGKKVMEAGTGPWKLESYTKDQQTVLVRNDDYWGEKPKLDKLVIKVQPDANTRAASLKAGEVQLAYGGMGSGEGGIPYVQLKAWLDGQDPSIVVEAKTGAGTRLLRINPTRGGLQDVRVRQAIVYAIDRKAINDSVFLEIDEVATSFFSTRSLYSSDNAQALPFDLAKSAELLAAAGYKDANSDGLVEKDGQSIQVEIVFMSQRPDDAATAQIIQANLLQAGIDGKITAVADMTAMADALTKGQYDLAIYTTYAIPFDPDLWIMWRIGDPLMKAVEGAEQADTWMKTFVTTMDEAERRDTLHKVTKWLIEDGALYIPLDYGADYVAYRTEVKDMDLAAMPSVFYLAAAIHKAYIGQ